MPPVSKPQLCRSVGLSRWRSESKRKSESTLPRPDEKQLVEAGGQKRGGGGPSSTGKVPRQMDPDMAATLWRLHRMPSGLDERGSCRVQPAGLSPVRQRASFALTVASASLQKGAWGACSPIREGVELPGVLPLLTALAHRTRWSCSA